MTIGMKHRLEKVIRAIKTKEEAELASPLAASYHPPRHHRSSSVG